MQATSFRLVNTSQGKTFDSPVAVGSRPSFAATPGIIASPIRSLPPPTFPYLLCWPGWARLHSATLPGEMMYGAWVHILQQLSAATALQFPLLHECDALAITMIAISGVPRRWFLCHIDQKADLGSD